MRGHKKILFIITILTGIVICFIKCIDSNNSIKDPRGALYVGSATCISCHKDVEGSYMHTSHYNASSRSNYNNLKNLIHSTNAAVSFENSQTVSIEDVQSQFFQSYAVNGHQVRSEKMDIVFGSGKKAQTYGYWSDSQLYELPLSYLSSLKIFTNSPGFPIYKPYYTRVIPSRCLECHASFINAKQERVPGLLQMTEKFDSSSLIYGIDCERCHGPGAQHVQFQKDNPNIKEAKYIVKIKSLARQQQLDLCASCHAGDPVKMRSIFSFLPGDTLSNYYLFYTMGNPRPDVHGMQLQSLRLSQCFLQSNLTCITCHQSHNDDNNLQTMSSKCISCHQQSTQHAVEMNVTGSNCITCHMPEQASLSLDFNNQTMKNNIPYLLRTHKIAVYPKAEWK